MVYDNLTNDALLEIGMYLDYRSIVSWSQTSHRHHDLLLQSKHILLNVAKSWDFSVPLSLPVHLTEEALTPADMQKAMRRAVALDLAWRRRRFRAFSIGIQSLDCQDDYPGWMINNVHYLELNGLSLALVSIQDVNSDKCIAVYQISPPKLVAVWEAGHGEVICWSHRWVDMGCRVKRLIVAISVERPRWAEPETRNSMEIYTLNFEDYLSNNGIPSKGPIEFKPAAKCYWRDSFTHIALSDHICGGLVFTEESPVVLCCLDWRKGAAENILISAQEHDQLAGIDDYTKDIEFNTTRLAQLFHVKDWVGVIQSSDALRCLLVPIRVGYPTSPIPSLSAFPPFRIKAEAKAIGVTDEPSAAEIGFMVGGQPTMMPSALHQEEKIVFFGEGDRVPSHNICVVDFRVLTASNPDAFEPGYHELPTPNIECVCDIMEFPKLGLSGHCFARSHAGRLPAPKHQLDQLPFSYYGNQREERVTTAGISMVHQSIVTMDDAAGVLCMRDDSENVLTFYRLE